MSIGCLSTTPTESGGSLDSTAAGTVVVLSRSLSPSIPGSRPARRGITADGREGRDATAGGATGGRKTVTDPGEIEPTVTAASTESVRNRVGRAIRRSVRCAILAVFLAGVRRRNLGAAVNGAVAFAVSFLPSAVERRYGVEFRPWQRAYVTSAMLAHSVGMLGLYDDTRWWDHLTHTLSASLLGGLVHAGARRRGHPPRPRVVAAVAVGGVLWELAEYAVHALTDRLGLDPALIPYSARDTAGDLLFDLLGALLVVAFGDHLLRNFVRDGDD